MFPLALLLLGAPQPQVAASAPSAPVVAARPNEPGHTEVAASPTQATPPPLLAARAEPSVPRSYTLILLSKGAHWGDGSGNQRQAWEEPHASAVRRHLEQGTLLAAAVVTAGSGDLRGFWVGATSASADAQALVASDPAVQAGYLRADVLGMLSTDGLVRRSAALRTRAGAFEALTAYQLVLVRLGPRHDPRAETENQQLGAARRAWLDTQDRAGRLVLSAPFTGGVARFQGMLLLKAGSLDAAHALVGTDPMVRTERFIAEVYSVALPQGLLE